MKSNSSRSWLPAARPPEADAVPVAQVAHGSNNTLTVITGSREVIFSSGYARDVALRQSPRRSSDGFLPKPYDAATLVHTICDVLGERQPAQLRGATGVRPKAALGPMTLTPP